MANISAHVHLTLHISISDSPRQQWGSSKNLSTFCTSLLLSYVKYIFYLIIIFTLTLGASHARCHLILVNRRQGSPYQFSNTIIKLCRQINITKGWRRIMYFIELFWLDYEPQLGTLSFPFSLSKHIFIWCFSCLDSERRLEEAAFSTAISHHDSSCWGAEHRSPANESVFGSDFRHACRPH